MEMWMEVESRRAFQILHAGQKKEAKLRKDRNQRERNAVLPAVPAVSLFRTDVKYPHLLANLATLDEHVTVWHCRC